MLAVDNLNSFYDGGLKQARLNILQAQPGFQFVKGDIADFDFLQQIFGRYKFGSIVHLAAQAGVRYSLENPHLYLQSNITGFVNLLELARRRETPHFVFASSSSVYGANKKIPFSEDDNVDYPVSLYAATKKSDELIAHVYAHLYGLPLSGLRFFTVYGPWGRPDMAVFKFTRAILEGKPLELYNHGKMQRDFTYIDDIVEGVVRTLERPPDGTASPVASGAKYRIYNIGNNQPVELMRLIELLEEKVGKKAIVQSLPMQPGDVHVTYASIDQLSAATGYRPHTPLEVGISRFVDWYLEFYKAGTAGGTVRAGG